VNFTSSAYRSEPNIGRRSAVRAIKKWVSKNDNIIVEGLQRTGRYVGRHKHIPTYRLMFQLIVLSAVCSLRVIHRVATTATDFNCTSKWVPHTAGEFTNDGRLHSGASTLTECQKACEFDPRCVAVDLIGRNCWITTNPNHGYHTQHWNGRHYHLVSRCNIASGQYFHDILARSRICVCRLSPSYG